MGDLSGGGDFPDLLEWFEGVDDERIDGRDVGLMVLMNLMVLTSGRFNVKEGWLIRNEVEGGRVYITLRVPFTPDQLLGDE